MNSDTSKETIGILRDLVKINNDRIEGYIKAIEETPAEQNNLLSLFRQMIEQSEGYVQELQALIQANGGEQADHSTTGMGKVYRLWMDIRAGFLGNRPKTVLGLCEFGEDAALRAYKEALESEETFETEIRSVILRQEAALIDAHNIIKSHRDQLQSIDM